MQRASVLTTAVPRYFSQLIDTKLGVSGLINCNCSVAVFKILHDIHLIVTNNLINIPFNSLELSPQFMLLSDTFPVMYLCDRILVLKPNTMFLISLIKERRGEREDLQEFHLKVLHIKEILSISCMMYPAQLSAGLGFLEPDFAIGRSASL